MAAIRSACRQPGGKASGRRISLQAEPLLRARAHREPAALVLFSEARTGLHRCRCSHPGATSCSTSLRLGRGQRPSAAKHMLLGVAPGVQRRGQCRYRAPLLLIVQEPQRVCPDHSRRPRPVPMQARVPLDPHRTQPPSIAPSPWVQSSRPRGQGRASNPFSIKMPLRPRVPSIRRQSACLEQASPLRARPRSSRRPATREAFPS